MQLKGVCMLLLLVIKTPPTTAESFTDEPLEEPFQTLENSEQESKTYFMDPRELIHNFLPGISSELEPYVELQMMLDDIVERSHLYDLPEDSRIAKEKELQEDPNVQNLIKRCKEFQKMTNCNSTLYRNFDGTCNNLNNTDWGSTDFKNDRLLPASYAGANGFRKAVNGEKLPLPRSIILTLNGTQLSDASEYASAMFVFFGQTVAHETTLSPATSKNGKVPDCCAPSSKSKPECITLDVEKNDPYYSQFNMTCLGFVRNAPYPSCNFEKRTFINKKTSFIDGSIIYGNNEVEAEELRKNDGSGRLKTMESDVGHMLPKNKDVDCLFCPVNEIENCFVSGDERANQHTMLMAWQTILVRLHNIIADNLHDINPNWDGEKIYQEARRLVGAIQQCIIYREFLPLLVGPENMIKYNLTIDFQNGSLYDDRVRPNILSEFNVASFRLHSMVPKNISSFHPHLRMANTFSWSSPIHEGQAGSLVAGSGEVPADQNDGSFTEAIVGLLYGYHGASFGFDMASFTIQRGRDHGLPPYVDLVRKCSDEKGEIQNFSDLNHTMTEENIELLKNIYNDVSDIDLWIGLLMETAIKDGVTGPTAACISAIQFHLLKFGDGFFFTHTNGRNPFTEEQLNFLKMCSLAQVLCATTNISEIRLHPLVLPGENNYFVSCQSLLPINIEAWKE